MKTLLIAALMSISLSATSITTKNFWGHDKQKHFLASATIATIATGTAKHYGYSAFESFWIGFGSSIIIGTLKEYSDGKNDRYEDIEDIYANMIGAASGAVVSAQFTWKF